MKAIEGHLLRIQRVLLGLYSLLLCFLFDVVRGFNKEVIPRSKDMNPDIPKIRTDTTKDQKNISLPCPNGCFSLTFFYLF